MALIIKTKQFEVEETISAIDENGNTLYEFVMQITGDEQKRINEILVHKEGVKTTKELDRLHKEGDLDKIAQKEVELEKLLADAEEKFADIVFKNHKELFKQAVGEYRYLEMLEMIFDFFWKAFTEKKAQRVNTMRSDLAKITNK